MIDVGVIMMETIELIIINIWYIVMIEGVIEGISEKEKIRGKRG